MFLLAGLISCADDLLLTKLILSRKPKCMEAFYQRQWLLNKSQSLNSFDQIMEEKRVCNVTSIRHLNNYHSWNHRLWLLKQTLLSVTNSKQFLFMEFDEMKKWSEVHVSEHSGLYYFNKLVESIIDYYTQHGLMLSDSPLSALDPLAAVKQMLQWNKSLITSFSGHEALLYARRTLLLKYKKLSDTDHKEGLKITDKYPEAMKVGSAKVTTKGKKKELTEAISEQAVKRSCVESVHSDWCAMVSEETNFVLQRIKSPESPYEKKLLECYLNFITRLSL